jgi:MinD-like ATPase involved in chromosome partitioning or flagellar assembly
MSRPAAVPRAPTPASVEESALSRAPADVAGRGWRRLLATATRGRANPGPDGTELAGRERLARIRVPLDRPRRVAVTSLKGGVGKTTVTALLGLMLAEHRGDRVVAVDANPDAGTLADRLSGDAARTVRDLVRDLAAVDSWTAVSRYTSLAGRLQVLASEQDPAAAEAFSRAEYEAVLGVLARYFTVILTDSGTGLVHSAMEGTLALADGLVVVGSQTVDAVGRASRTLDWLDAHGRGDLVRGAVVVLSGDRRSPGIDMARVHAHFRARCRAVTELPPDPHLATGGRIDPDRLRPATRLAAQELAALVADGFGPRRGVTPAATTWEGNR